MAGVGVVPYPTFSFLKILSIDSVCTDLIGTALDVSNAIDCVVFVDGLYFRGQRSRVPLSLRRAGLPTVLIATDDPYESIPNADSLYTYRFTNEIHSAVRGAVYLPTASSPMPQISRLDSPTYDVSFLGTVFSERMPFLVEIAQYCERQGLRFLIAGKFMDGTEAFRDLTYTEVRSRTIDTPEKWEIYAHSKLTINLFRPSEQEADSPNPRVFEATGFGHAALLTGPVRSEIGTIFGDSVYEFADVSSAIKLIEEALGNPVERIARVDRAREITLSHHTYEHRAQELVSSLRAGEHERSISTSSEEKVAWIIGCGRTGSTWLAEMLGDLPRINRWHEPYFGRFFRHVQDRPKDLKRRSSFFAQKHQQVWLEGMRELFFRMVRDRYPQFGQQGLAVKEVNTPELYRWLQHVFPAGRMIFLKRDPFDILDSYLDLQKPGSWNEDFGNTDNPLEASNVKRTAEHIRASLAAALEAFEHFPDTQRLEIPYEDLLADPAPLLRACGDLISIPVDHSDIGKVVEKHAFKNYKQSGPLAFRRRGQSGVWKDSPNFTPEVTQIAEEVLGPIRGRLSYRDTPS